MEKIPLSQFFYTSAAIDASDKYQVCDADWLENYEVWDNCGVAPTFTTLVVMMSVMAFNLNRGSWFAKY